MLGSLLPGWSCCLSKAVVKNTFLEVQGDEEEEAPKLRLVHTARGLDSKPWVPAHNGVFVTC